MKLLFTGDISLYNIDYQNFEFSDTFKKLISCCSLVIGNLECPITDSTLKEENQAVNMSASASSMKLLKPFQIVSLANNHIRDYKSQGIKDTINALEREGIRYFGAGKTQNEALEPIEIVIKGFKLALLGATRYSNATSKNGGGTARDKITILSRKIRRLKKEGYFVVPYFHWGYEYIRIPSPRDRKIAHRCIDAGADLIIGSHPHIYQVIEEYKGKTIVYSLGNFIFHSSVFKELSPIEKDPRLNESFVFTVEVKEDHSYESSIYGFHTNDFGIQFYNDTKNKKLISEINEVSAILKGTRLAYLKAYYKLTYDISKQNIRVRKNFQNFQKLDLNNKIKVYRTANLQDLKNRMWGYFLSIKNIMIIWRKKRFLKL